MATFALIHGAWHGGWCFGRLIAELAVRGHAAVAPDLRCDDPDADFRDHARTVVEALEGASGPIVLVGHSLGGVLLPIVAAARPVARQAYLAAILHPSLEAPGGVRPLDMPRTHPPGAFRGLERFPDGSHRWRSVDEVAPVLYNRCSADDAAWAFSRLRTQQTRRAWASVPVPDPWPSGPVTSIVCRDDRTVDPAWSTWVARAVLRVRPHELDADHSPFLSAPAALADLLDRIAAAPAEPD